MNGTPERTLILGAGRSGRAAAELLRSEGGDVSVWAEESASFEQLRSALRRERFGRCVISPGFAADHPWAEAVRSAGVPLTAELELGWSRHKGRTVAVTGSNGKSTAVKWLADILRADGKRAAIGGNYGIPACEAVSAHPEADWLVLEVSSFQLETVRRFRPDVGTLLNVLPNHLDRHGSMERYRRLKLRLFEKTGPEDAVVLPASLAKSAPGRGRKIAFGAGGAYRFERGRVLLEGGVVADLSGTAFDHPVLGPCTGAAVVAAAMACGASRRAIETAARAFEPLPHRFSEVGVAKGVRYVNDSKSTNLAALMAAVRGCDGGVRLIAGGKPKGEDYNLAKEILAERVRSIYLVGQASGVMRERWRSVCSCETCDTLERAFRAARRAAEPGDTVLLSPGCASFDQFDGFEARGAFFERLVREALRE